MGLRIGQRYTGLGQANGQVLVAAVGAPTGSGVLVTSAYWAGWFGA